jgi:ketosteroid isomerase-like protein
MTPVVALAWLACPSAPPIEVDATPPSAEGVRATLTAGYRAVEAGDAGRLAPLFTADALVIGLGGSDLWSGAGIEGGLRGALAPVADADRVAIEDSRIVVGLADGDGAAWAFDAPRVTVVHEGTTEVWLPRLTAHLVHRGARWEIDALHLSLPLSDEGRRQERRLFGLPPPTR